LKRSIYLYHYTNKNIQIYLILFYCSLEPDNIKYDEELTLNVQGVSSNITKDLYSTRIEGKQKFNSWFYFAFDKDIFIPKEIKCCIEVIPKDIANYQKIAMTPASSPSKLVCISYMWNNYNPQNYIIKSVTLDRF